MTLAARGPTAPTPAARRQRHVRARARAAASAGRAFGDDRGGVGGAAGAPGQTTAAGVATAAVAAGSVVWATGSLLARHPAHPAVVAAALIAAALAAALALGQRAYEGRLQSARDVAYADSRFLNTPAGYALHYKRVDANGGRDVALCVHGFGANTYSWEVGGALELLAGLPSVGSALAYDCPGFGLTERPSTLPGYSLGAYADAGEALLDAEAGEDADASGPRRLILIGHSVGGIVATMLAGRLGPERVRAVVLVAPAILAGRSSRARGREGLLAYCRRRAEEDTTLLAGAFFTAAAAALAATRAAFLLGIRAALRASLLAFALPLRLVLRRLCESKSFWAKGLQSAWYSPIAPTLVDGYARPARVRGWDAGMVMVIAARLLVDTLPSPLDASVDSAAARDDGEGQAGASAEFARNKGDANDLAALGVPVLIVHGAQDRLVPASNSARLVNAAVEGAADERIANVVELVQFDACGHCPQEERALEFAGVVGSFLERCPP